MLEHVIFGEVLLAERGEPGTDGGDEAAVDDREIVGGELFTAGGPEGDPRGVDDPREDRCGVDGAAETIDSAPSTTSEPETAVVETALPHAWIPSGQPDYVHAEQIGLDAVVLDVARYDPVTQLLEENHVRISTSGITMNPIVCRLITPGEMDLMARLAGLRLVERFANWQRTPFDAQSTAHVSLYALSDGVQPAGSALHAA